MTGPALPRHPIEDVLQHRTQISGQPVLVMDAAIRGARSCTRSLRAIGRRIASWN
jgi:hypothetical protein